jgi:hypothetical protein
MSAPDETVLTSGSVPPGATVDIAVKLKAPTTGGTYKGYFRLKSPDNIVFGIGASGMEAFWCKLILWNFVNWFQCLTHPPEFLHRHWYFILRPLRGDNSSIAGC